VTKGTGPFFGGKRLLRKNCQSEKWTCPRFSTHASGFTGYNDNMNETQPAATQHVSSKPGVCGGKPCIEGTRIRVYDIHVWHDLQGKTAAEIATEFPQISVADVYAALTYYHDHRESIESQMADDDAFAAALRAQQGETRFSKLRDQLSVRLNGGDPISS
jgi:uncharacterized protein (DUF433 family)